jgi:2'-5' RNA ligase
MRCFVSIEIPEHIRSEIFHVFDKLKNSGVCSGNFVEKMNLHLTLTFLGELDEEKLESVKNVLSKIDFRKFPVETGDIGFFPNKEFVKVLWVEIVSNEISSLRDEIESKLKKEGFEFKNIDFVPHLTVARIKSIKDKKNFHSIVDEFHLPKMFFVAEDFVLMKTILKKNSIEYKFIEKYGMRIRG